MSEKFQIVESTTDGVSHSESNLPFNRNDRIDNLIHWIYQNAELKSGESIEHNFIDRSIKIFKRVDDGSEEVILCAKFCVPSEECCNGKKCCKGT